MQNLTDIVNSLLIESYGIYQTDKIELLGGVGPNLNFKIVVERGCNYILQCSSLENEELKREMEFAQLLKKNEIPVNEFISCKNGDKIFSNNMGNWVLKKYINGKIFELNSCQEIKMAATMLARIHHIPFRGNKYFFASIHDPYYWLYDMNKELELLEREIAKEITLCEIKETVFAINSCYSLEDYKKLPLAIVHGDYHGRNLLFCQKKINGVLDLDTIGISPRIIDVAEAIFLMGRQKYGSYYTNNEIIFEFLKRYEEFFPLTNDEIEVAGLILKLRMIPRAKYIRLLKKKSYISAINQIEWSKEAVKLIDKVFTKENLVCLKQKKRIVL